LACGIGGQDAATAWTFSTALRTSWTAYGRQGRFASKKYGLAAAPPHHEADEGDAGRDGCCEWQQRFH
jgi:hypothetical protein